MTKNKPDIRFLLFICSIILLNLTAFSQKLSLTDSIKNLIKASKEDSSKTKLFLELGEVFESNNSDSAEQYYNKALELAQKVSDKKYIARCYDRLGLFYSANGNYEIAIKNFQLLLKISESQNNKVQVAYSFLNTGEIYMYQGNYPKSLEYFQKAVKIYEEVNKSPDKSVSVSGKKGMVRCYNNLGGVHAENGNFKQATEYFQKALTIELQIGDKRVISGCYNNIGNVYYMQNEFQQAIVYYQKSLKMAEEINDKQGMSERYNNLGLVYADNRNHKLAIDYYMKSFKIDEELGNQKGMAIVLGNVSLLKIQLKNYKEAIQYAEESLELAKKIGSLDEEKCAYSYLATAYDSLKDYKKTCEYLKLFKLMNDSIFNIESGKQIKEMEAVYQTEKKQKEIALLSKDKELQKAEISKQETQKYGFIIGFILMLMLSIVVFRNYNQKKKANALLTLQKHQIEEKNEELNQQNEEISAQRDEIESQRDMLFNQKEKIEEIHYQLTSSIHYAKRIQQAVLPNKEFVDTLLTDYFILLKPRNIVSGDFYWLTIRKNFLLVAVADCTGHGVPGAFMSMLGMSFLNEIVVQEEITKANQVLNVLREYVLKSLQQKGASGEQKDGMDIAFICVNLESTYSDSGVEQFEVQFAGANNPLYVIAKEVPINIGMTEATSLLRSKISNIDNTGDQIASPRFVGARNDEYNLIEIKGDKMPVAIYRNMPDFTNHEFVLQKGDIIYLSTDGFSDQFGGSNKRKYLSKNFKKLLQKISEKPMEEQKFILNETIESWMNNNGNTFEQTDDITVMGIKI